MGDPDSGRDVMKIKLFTGNLNVGWLCFKSRHKNSFIASCLIKEKSVDYTINNQGTFDAGNLCLYGGRANLRRDKLSEKKEKNNLFHSVPIEDYRIRNN